MNSLSIKNLNRQVPNIINMMSQSDGLFRLLLMQTNEPSSLQDAVWNILRLLSIISADTSNPLTQSLFSRVYLDFVSDPLSFTIKSLKNIDLTQDQTTQMIWTVGAWQSQSNILIWTLSKILLTNQWRLKPWIQKHRAAPCNNTCNLSIQSFIRLRWTGNLLNAVALNIQGPSTSCEDTINQLPATNDREASAIDNLAPLQEITHHWLHQILSPTQPKHPQMVNEKCDG